MKIQIKVTDPDSVQITITATMQLRGWEHVADALAGGAGPSREFCREIRKQVGGVREYLVTEQNIYTNSWGEVSAPESTPKTGD